MPPVWERCLVSPVCFRRVKVASMLCRVDGIRQPCHRSFAALVRAAMTTFRVFTGFQSGTQQRIAVGDCLPFCVVRQGQS